MAFAEDDLMKLLRTQLAIAAAPATEDDVEAIATALAIAIFEFLKDAAEAGDLDA
tara:strand:- start:788 stop:952 length:165 start_codon:yes stop_codon:yes gene_type:complete